MYQLTQRDDVLAVLGIDDLTHGAVNGRQATEDALETSNHGDGMVTGKITKSQQHKQNGQRTKDNLGCAVMLQSANEHKSSEDAPQ